jgi:hypothetical protein
MADIFCPSCGTKAAAGHRFCGNCGHDLAPLQELEGTTPPSQPAFPAQKPTGTDAMVPKALPALKARLRLIRGDGIDGFTFQLQGTEHAAGRIAGPILFPDDTTVSPRHALFSLEGATLTLRDLGSRNGTFIRLFEPKKLEDGEIFLCGEQVMRFELYREVEPEKGEDGAVFGGTPLVPYLYRLVQVLPGGATGIAYCSTKKSVTLGRDDCDINFLHDRFISRYHTRIDHVDADFVVRDLDSRNGTYMKLAGDRTLREGDYIFLGRQLLRVEFE